MQQKLEIFQQELKQELHNILQYWMQHTIDAANGGFYGSVDNNNQPVSGAPKGIVLTARILWTFSEAYQLSGNKILLEVAGRAFHYILTCFTDTVYGGVYWSVDEKGNMLESRKQIYGLAFCMYGMSAYAAASNNNEAMEYAVRLYHYIEKYSYDPEEGGYLEACSREWHTLDNCRLSAKDANEKKTMNTHLHIIEAYAALYKIWPNELLKQKITKLLELIDKYFINHLTHHLRLFFDERWNEKIDVISYGHDIEAGWLLLQCAEISGDKEWINIFRQHAIGLTDAAMRGLDNDGGLWYEYEQNTRNLIKEKHWWPQAEAMVGFFNAYQLTKEEIFLQHTLSSWHFIKTYLVDTSHGEWFWGIKEDYSIMPGQDKAGFWKCPYHNARACMEVIARLNQC